jgi:hypothetical protein
MEAKDIITKLTREEKIDIAETFLATFLRGGFGAMTKREVELLVFHCLERTDSFNKLSFYDRANALRILESKVKSLKAEATQRYAQLDHRSAIYELAVGVARHKTIPASYEGGRIVLVIENPALRRELEHAMRKDGARMDYTLNADVVSVDLDSFLQLLRRTVALGDEELAKRLATGVTDQKASKKLLAKELPLADRVKAFLDENKGAAGAVGSLLKGFASAAVA